MSKNVCQPGLKRLAEMFSRRPETISRAMRALQERQLIKIIRRGKTLTNVYRLARWLWETLTGDPRRHYPWAFAQVRLPIRGTWGLQSFGECLRDVLSKDPPWARREVR